MTSIQKITAYKPTESVVVLVSDEKNKFGLLDFSKAELDYIKTQFATNKKNRVAINRFNKWIFVQRVEEKKEKHSIDRQSYLRPFRQILKI